MPSHKPRHNVIHMKRYKTSLCQLVSLADGVTCPYGDRCLFAHCESELRTVEQNVKEGVTAERIAKWAAEKKRLDSTAISDCSLTLSEGYSNTSHHHHYVIKVDRPSPPDARSALRRLWRDANRHQTSFAAAPVPITAPWLVVPAPTRNPHKH